MRIESLALFLGIIRTGSFRGAAQSMYVSQQGLSKSMHSLETELGCTLFDRSNKKVTLTETGRIVEPYARAIVENAHGLHREIAAYRSAMARHLSEHLTILAAPQATDTVLYCLREELADAGLGKVTVIECSQSDAIERVVHSEVPTLALLDVVTDELPSLLAEHPTLVYDRVSSIHVTVVGTRDLLPTDMPEIAPEELKGIPIAYYNAANVQRFVETIVGIDPADVVMRVTNFSMIYETVHKGLAATFGDDLTDRVDKQRRDLVSIRVSQVPPTSLGFLYRNDKPLDDDQETYIRSFKTVIRDVNRKYVGGWLLDD